MYSMSSNIKTTHAQLLTDRYEVVATLEQPSQIKSGTTMAELNYTVNYDISSVLMFAKETNITLNQGLIAHWIEHQPTEASIIDNLGNSFSPIINDTSISTPFITNIAVPSSFEYRITLHFKTTDDVRFDDKVNNFVMAYVQNQIPVPMTITFRLPNDYSVFQQAEGASKSTGGQYNLFKWDFDQGENVQCYAVFLPFSIQPTVRSMGITIEALTSSVNSGLRETFSLTYDLIGTVMIWNVTLVMPINIPFPTNINGTWVESVIDGKGACELRTEPINQKTGDPLGKFFVDNTNKLVTVYPRNSYQDVTQKFDLEITFVVPNDPSDNNISVDIPFWEPYKGFTGLVFNFYDSPLLHLNMTGTFRVTFVFPSGVDSFSSPDGESFVEGEEGGKPTVTYLYNSPINLPKKQWVVLYDTISRRNFLTNQEINILLLIVALGSIVIVTKTLKTKTKKALVGLLLTLAPLTLVIENFREFVVLGWFNFFVIVCTVIEVLFSIGVIAFIIRFYKEIP